MLLSEKDDNTNSEDKTQKKENRQVYKDVLACLFTMETTRTYHKENKAQKELNKLIQLFRVDYKAVRQLKEKGLETYNPKVKKWRVGVAVGLFGACAITPFTPEILIIPKLLRWVLK